MIEIDDESLSPPKPATIVAAPPAKTLAEAMAALSVAPVPALSLSAAAPIPMPPQPSAVAVPSVPPQNLETTLDELPK